MKKIFNKKNFFILFIAYAAYIGFTDKDINKNIGNKASLDIEKYEEDYTYLVCSADRTDQIGAGKGAYYFRFLPGSSQLNPLALKSKEPPKISLTPYQKGFLASKRGSERRKLEKEFLKDNREAAYEEKTFEFPIIFIDWAWNLALYGVYGASGNYGVSLFSEERKEFMIPRVCPTYPAYRQFKNDPNRILDLDCKDVQDRSNAARPIPAKNNILESYLVSSDHKESEISKLVGLSKLQSSQLPNKDYTSKPYITFNESIVIPKFDRQTYNLYSSSMRIEGKCEKIDADTYTDLIKDEIASAKQYINKNIQTKELFNERKKKVQEESKQKYKL